MRQVFNSRSKVLESSYVTKFSVCTLCFHNLTRLFVPAVGSRWYTADRMHMMKGGKNDSILILNINTITDYYSEDELGDSFQNIPTLINDFLQKNPGGIVTISEKYFPKNFSGKLIPVKKIGIWQFLTVNFGIQQTNQLHS